MRSHFLPQKVTAVCAVAGATTLLSGGASAQNFVAADYATNSTYASGWAAGQNGGYGFGPWSFDGTTDISGNSDPGAQQGISSSAAIGAAWTLFNSTANPPPQGPGISDVGRAIAAPGGLETGQTLEVVIQNPTAYHFYRGYDILCLNGTNNDPAGVGVAAIRAQVFDYYISNWGIVDYYGGAGTSLDSATTAVAGMKFDLTLTSTNTYSVTLTPLSNPSAAYSQTGMLTTNLPINWINFRLYLGPTTGVNDTADNLFISSMTIQGLMLNIQKAGTNAVLSWLDIPGYYLESCTNLGPPANWTSNSISPVVVNGENMVTNPIAGKQQYFRLELQQ